MSFNEETFYILVIHGKKTHSLGVKPSQRIYQVKEELAGCSGLLPHQQVLHTYSASQTGALQDEHTVDFYNLGNCSALSLKAKDVVDISPVHFYMAAGLTAGLRNFRVGVQYQYAFTNLFAKVNDREGIDQSQGKIKANPSNLGLVAFFYF